MKELNILFAINNTSNHNLESAILKKYEEKYDKKFSYDKAFYLIAIMKSLEEKHYDILILSENLESTFDISFIDKITDKHPDLRVILRLDDRRRGTSFIRQIYSIACYDCIFQQDFKMDTLVDLIENPRNKKMAKEYYDLDDENFENIPEAFINNLSVREIPEDELEQILISLNAATPDDIEKLFNIAINSYNFEQMTYLISIIRNNKKLINLLKDNNCNIEPYEKALDTVVNKKNVSPKVIEKVVEKPVEKIVEKVVEKVVEKKVIENKYIDREIEVVKEVYKTPTDYKKVVAVIGADRRVGTTTVIEVLAKKFTEDNKRVSIVDFSANHNLFERHIFNEEEKSEPLKDLITGFDKPYKINNKCLLYTSSPSIEKTNYTSSEMNKVIDILKLENDIILMDLELEDLEKVYPIIDKILIIVSQDLTTTKYFTTKFDTIMTNIYLGNFNTKASFIINKYLPEGKVLSSKELIECYLYKVEDYMNTDLNKEIIENKFPIFKIDFNIDILTRGYRGDKYISVEDEGIEEDIYAICNSIYPMSTKSVKTKRKGFLSGLIKSKK